ncbi:MAG: ImmA/IrrE family metallo-endopeptidase [Candidatus Dormiibacterota bacterium]
MTFLSEAQIEAAAARLWITYGLEPRFDPEQLLDQLGLGLVWEEVDDPEEGKLLALLAPSDKQVVLNERHLEALEAKDGRLRRFTISHEVGHWILHAEAIRSGTLSLFVGDRIFCRVGSKARPEIQAEIFASALLIPLDRLRPRLPRAPWQGWPPVYQLADQFLVSPTAMRVRLERLRLMHVDSELGPRSGPAPVPRELDLPL